MLRSRSVILALALFVAVSSSVGAARASPAEQPTESELAEARSLFFAGVEAQDRGSYRDALDSYERAARVASSATLLFNIGTCHERLGELVEAEAAFARSAAGAASHGDTEVEAEGRAKIAALRDEIPRVVVRMAPHVRMEDVTATLDDAPIATSVLAELRLNPGTHRLVIRSQRHARVFAVTIELPARATRAIDVDLGGERINASETRPIASPAPAAAGTTYAPALIAGGAALALGGGAIVTWLIGHDARERYEDMNLTPTAANRAERERLHDSATTTYALNAGCIVGAALAVGATVYFLVRPPRGSRTHASASYLLRF